MKPNPGNERLKHRYFAYLREAGQLGEHSIDQVAKALDRFEQHTRRRSFREFRIEQATSFKRALSKEGAERDGRKLSTATIASTLHCLRRFFIWASEQKGFRTRMSRTDADYFKPSRHDEAIARAPRQVLVPTLSQVRAMIAAVPMATTIDRRNRALIAFIILTGARDNAAASTRMRHLDLIDRQLYQDGRDMRTKFRKTFPTWFFPIGSDVEAIVSDWKSELERDHGFEPDDALFPQTVVTFGPSGEVMPPNLGRACWANADPIRKVFKDACRAAGLPNFTPHSFRHTLAQVGGHLCTTPAEYKAWSQNLGHDGAMVTLTSYGNLPGFTQKELIRGIGTRMADGGT
jgi:integrase